jgi:hypothetical protein
MCAHAHLDVKGGSSYLRSSSCPPCAIACGAALLLMLLQGLPGEAALDLGLPKREWLLPADGGHQGGAAGTTAAALAPVDATLFLGNLFSATGILLLHPLYPGPGAVMGHVAAAIVLKLPLGSAAG